MEPENAKNDENEKAIEGSEVEKDEVSEKNANVVLEEAEGNNENEVVETSAGENSKAEEKSVETLVHANQDLAALKVPLAENKVESSAVEEPTALASVEATSSGTKMPKTVKMVKKLVKRKLRKGTCGQVAGEENVTAEQGIKKRSVKEDEQNAEPSLGESEKEINNVIESVADFPQSSSGKDNDLETSLGGDDMEVEKEVEELADALQPADVDEKIVGGEPSAKETLKEVKGKASIPKRQKGKKVKGNLAQGMDKESATIFQGTKEEVDMDSIVSDKRDVGASSGGNVIEAEKALDGSVAATEKILSVEKNQPRKLKAKAKLRKTPAEIVQTEVNKGTVGETGLAVNNKRINKRRRKQVLDSNKKPKKEEVDVADATQQKTEERKEQLVNPKKSEMDEHGKVKIGGLIFMCNAKTRPDCFRFSVMGVQENKKDYVMGIKPGLKLFLYDYDLKLFYGIFQASSAGGMKLERNAFGGAFPAQVRFKIFSDCMPLPESEFKKAIKENYNSRNKFKTELTHKQVIKLKKLFRPSALPAQLTHARPIPAPRVVDRTRSDRDRYAPSSSRTHSTRTHERRRRASPPPRREEQPRDLYLSEREYRTYGLRRAETTQHYPVPPPETSSYHSVNRDRVRLDSYSSSVDHDRLLRQEEIERRDHREVRRVHLPERDYRTYDHRSSRLEILGRNSPDPPASAVALDSYRRDPYYSYEYRDPERPPRAYMASPRREEHDLYSRYVTADSLAEYYRSSQRYPNISESELPPSAVASRYDYSGSLPYSRR